MKRQDIRQCPKCGGGTKVINTRVDKEGHIRRRHKCLECDYRYNTVEVMEEAGGDA